MNSKAINDEKELEHVSGELTDKENAAVEEAAKMLNKDAEKTDGIFHIELKTPLKYNGKEYDKLTFEFAKLTGRDSVNIEEELTAKGQNVFMTEIASAVYLMTMAARACVEKIPYNGLLDLDIVDFNRIKNKSRLFLLGVAV